MKRLFKLISTLIMCIAVAFACFACQELHSSHVDEDGDGNCDICGELINEEPCVHVDEDKDGKCDLCDKPIDEEPCVHVDEDKDGKCDLCDKPINKEPCVHVDKNHDGICDECKTEGLPYEHVDKNHDGICDVCGTGDLPYEHVDKNHDGICDVCKTEGLPYEHVDKNHDGICDVCGTGDLPYTHVDENHDGICDVCGTGDLPYTHVDEDHDGICDNVLCGASVTPAHIDRNFDGICDTCERTTEELSSKATLKNLIDKISLDKATVNFNGLMNASGLFGYELKFTESGFDLVNIITKPYSEQGENGEETTGNIVTTISMRDNDLYLLDNYIPEGKSEPVKQILQKISLADLPAEIKELTQSATTLFNSLIGYVKTGIFNIMPDIDLSFIKVTETESGITVSVNAEIGEKLETFRQTLLSFVGKSLHQLIKEYAEIDLESLVNDNRLIITVVGNSTLSSLRQTLDPVLQQYLGGNIESLLTSLLDYIGINDKAEQVYGALASAFGDKIIPPEGQTLAQYLLGLCDSAVGDIKVNQIVGEITKLFGKEYTLISLLDTIVDILKNKTIEDVLSFIDFDYLRAFELDTFNLILNIETDKNFKLQSADFKLITDCSFSTQNYNINLNGNAQTDAELMELPTELLKNNSALENIVDNLNGNFTMDMQDSKFDLKILPIKVFGFQLPGIPGLEKLEDTVIGNIKPFGIKANGNNFDIGPIHKDIDDASDLEESLKPSYSETYIYLRDGAVYNKTVIYNKDGVVLDTSFNQMFSIGGEAFGIISGILSCVNESSVYLKPAEQMLSEYLQNNLKLTLEKDAEGTGRTYVYNLDLTDLVNLAWNIIKDNPDITVNELITEVLTELAAENEKIQSAIDILNFIKTVPEKVNTLKVSDIIELVKTSNETEIEALKEQLGAVLQSANIDAQMIYGLVTRFLNKEIAAPNDGEKTVDYIIRIILSEEKVRQVCEMTLNEVLSLLIKTDFVTWYNENVLSVFDGLNISINEFLKSKTSNILSVGLLKGFITRFSEVNVGVRIRIDDGDNLKYVEVYANAKTNKTVFSKEYDSLSMDVSLKLSVKEIGATSLEDLTPFTSSQPELPPVDPTEEATEPVAVKQRYIALAA